ncbi:DUF5919 domain-containing protein [Micromonospora peucetia]|uniref:DUF5919 domain-containing protein n=1 Tax=Micromonospora peucetia TaxID=47871 RepID=A0A1C6UC10_9ACTN|nr:DUF5919 domain-containing protein [Micromonospora peucetia]MCX4386476.1 DUF5919 domain-containing protein [Micromonospora peucetia]WSA33811.1 DUF5919 domain-containing protein [Micromonospora peucetia]SCL51630.1 Helix-turn-helix domain [Micromonospora peucetia]
MTDLDMIEGGTMTPVQRWTGRETKTLRYALRMSIRDFAVHLGVAQRTVSKWEAGGESVNPRPEMQAALDTALAQAADEAQRRFASALHQAKPTAPDSVGGLDLGAAARQQVARTRQALGLSVGDFAAVLARTLTWRPTGDDVTNWETSTVPPGDVVLALSAILDPSAAAGEGTDRFGDLVAVHPNRSEFSTDLPPDQLLGGARTVRAVGLSLNLLAQGYPDRRWHDLVEAGAHVRLLFLDPAGQAVQAREVEEGFPAGQLSGLTKLNIETLMRVRDRLPDGLQERMEMAVYDDTLRFNVVLVDDLCVAQPYLAESRGVDSPTFVVRRRQARGGLYPVFEQYFETEWRRGQQL